MRGSAAELATRYAEAEPRGEVVLGDRRAPQADAAPSTRPSPRCARLVDAAARARGRPPAWWRTSPASRERLVWRLTEKTDCYVARLCAESRSRRPRGRRLRTIAGCSVSSSSRSCSLPARSRGVFLARAALVAAAGARTGRRRLHVLPRRPVRGRPPPRHLCSLRPRAVPSAPCARAASPSPEPSAAAARRSRCNAAACARPTRGSAPRPSRAVRSSSRAAFVALVDRHACSSARAAPRPRRLPRSRGALLAAGRPSLSAPRASPTSRRPAGALRQRPAGCAPMAGAGPPRSSSGHCPLVRRAGPVGWPAYPALGARGSPRCPAPAWCGAAVTAAAGTRRARAAPARPGPG